MVGPDSCKYLRHKKLHISTCRGRYNLGQHVFAFNSHTVCHTFKNLVSPDSLNGAESLCSGHAHLRLENSSLGFCLICVKLGTYTLQLDLILSYQKNFAPSKKAQIINKQISVASYKNVNCLISRSN